MNTTKCRNGGGMRRLYRERRRMEMVLGEKEKGEGVRTEGGRRGCRKRRRKEKMV
jgi:hypothetical protein